MGLINRVKSILPGSSRSLHSAHEDIVSRLCVIQERMEAAQFRIDSIGRSVGDLSSSLNELETELDAHDTHMKLFAWEFYRHDGESIEAAKRRFFRSLPVATAGARLLQLGNAKLLEEFDKICRNFEIPYWITFGTLLGAVRHGGFVPWDDDVDLGMMRDDIVRLKDIIDRNFKRYKITIVYDSVVYCRQIRFRYSDCNLPCFLDLFIYDWVPRLDQCVGPTLYALRQDLENEMGSSERLSFWRNAREYDEKGENGGIITKCFDRYHDIAMSKGLICDKASAQGIAWGIDNMSDAKQASWVYGIESVLPLTQCSFEGIDLQVPQDWDNMLYSQYGDYWILPRDINSHYKHVDREELESADVRRSLEQLLEC